MTLSLICACIWVVVANLLAMLPSKDNMWKKAYVLIAVGVPLLGWVTYENGAFVGVLALAAGMSVLRWPVLYLGRWVKSKMAHG